MVGSRVESGRLKWISWPTGSDVAPAPASTLSLTLPAPARQVGAAVKAALAAGYRHVDCAAVYGNEKEVGEVFKSVFRAADDSDELRVPRDEVFITSKLWNSEHGAGLPRPALENTLKVGCGV